MCEIFTVLNCTKQVFMFYVFDRDGMWKDGSVVNPWHIEAVLTGGVPRGVLWPLDDHLCTECGGSMT